MGVNRVQVQHLGTGREYTRPETDRSLLRRKVNRTRIFQIYDLFFFHALWYPSPSSIENFIDRSLNDVLDNFVRAFCLWIFRKNEDLLLILSIQFRKINFLVRYSAVEGHLRKVLHQTQSVQQMHCIRIKNVNHLSRRVVVIVNIVLNCVNIYLFYFIFPFISCISIISMWLSVWRN